MGLHHATTLEDSSRLFFECNDQLFETKINVALSVEQGRMLTNGYSSVSLFVSKVQCHVCCYTRRVYICLSSVVCVVIPLALRGGVVMGLELLPFRCTATERRNTEK